MKIQVGFVVAGDNKEPQRAFSCGMALGPKDSRSYTHYAKDPKCILTSLFPKKKEATNR